MDIPSLSKLCWTILLCVSASSCTNSKLVLRPLYNSVDNRIEDRILAHAEFDTQQTQEIKDLVDHFHVWHRRTQLEHYAELIDHIVVKLRDDNAVSGDDITLWSNTMNAHTSVMGSCNPFYNSAELLASLSDQQIADIRQHRIESRQARRAEREANRLAADNDVADEIFDIDPENIGPEDIDSGDIDPEDIKSADRVQDDRDQNQIDRREASISADVKQITRYLNLIGLKLNKAQIADLTDTMRSRIRPETPFRIIRDELDEAFYTLLEQRTKPDLRTLLVASLDKRRQRLAQWRKASRDHNANLWQGFALRTLQSFDDSQKDSAAKYLSGLALTIKALAKDAPSFQKRSASEYQCLGAEIS